jgi:hypothetical protein
VAYGAAGAAGPLFAPPTKKTQATKNTGKKREGCGKRDELINRLCNFSIEAEIRNRIVLLERCDVARISYQALGKSGLPRFFGPLLA